MIKDCLVVYNEIFSVGVFKIDINKFISIFPEKYHILFPTP